MPTRRQLLVTAAVAVLLVTSGCLGGGGSGKGAEIAERTTQSMADVDTYTAEMDISVTVESTGRSASVSTTGIVDRANERLRQEGTIRGQAFTQYFVGDTQYLKMDGDWQQRSIADRNVWDRQMIARQTELLEDSTVTFEGNTTVDGIDVYELRVDAPEDQLMSMVEQQQGSLPAGVSIEEVTYTMYVSHETDYLRRATADMTLSVRDRTATADMTMAIDDVGEDVSITVPPEARNASTVAR